MLSPLISVVLGHRSIGSHGAHLPIWKYYLKAYFGI